MTTEDQVVLRRDYPTEGKVVKRCFCGRGMELAVLPEHEYYCSHECAKKANPDITKILRGPSHPVIVEKVHMTAEQYAEWLKAHE